jgi:hypothetical protein
MTNVQGIEKLLEALERRAREILDDPDLTPVQKRRAIWALIREYGELKRYRAAMEAFIRRMLGERGQLPLDPECIVSELLASPEFDGLQCAVLAALLAATYGTGPRSCWVPFTLLPQPPEPAFTMDLRPW